MQGSRYGFLLDELLDRYFSILVPRVSQLLQKGRKMRDPGNEVGVIMYIGT